MDRPSRVAAWLCHHLPGDRDVHTWSLAGGTGLSWTALIAFAQTGVLPRDVSVALIVLFAVGIIVAGGGLTVMFVRQTHAAREVRKELAAEKAEILAVLRDMNTARAEEVKEARAEYQAITKRLGGVDSAIAVLQKETNVLNAQVGELFDRSNH